MVRGRSQAIVIVALLILLAAVPFAMLIPALAHGTLWPTGASGLFPLDQLQYMAQIRETGHLRHVLDHFPLFFVSGLASDVGVGVRLAFLAWIPVGAIVLVWGFGRYVKALLPEPGGQRLAALLLGLFFFSPLLAIAGWTMSQRNPSFEQVVLTGYYSSPAGTVWGYPQIALALGLMPVSLLHASRRGSDWRDTAVAGAAGAVVSFLHPWQGVTLVIVHLLTAASTAAARTVRIYTTILLTAMPVVYYWAATHLDARFGLAAAHTQVPLAPAWIQFAGLLPFAIVLAAVAHSRATSVRERQLVLWPVAALGCYWLLGTSWQPYFLLGVSMPAAVLAVRASGRLRRMRRPLAAVATAAFTLPGTAFAIDLIHQREHSRASADLYRVREAERRALTFIAAARRPGAVMASGNLASAAWAFTDRKSWAANPLVNPEYEVGSAEADNLFAGRLKAAGARRFVVRTRAKYLLSGCAFQGHDLTPDLGPLLLRARRFGCATVYELR